jgi:pimeloyl-ACP methyl ester carboxylesterase
MELQPILNRVLRKVLVRRGVVSAMAQVNAHRLHYYQVQQGGLGPPLLLIHGLGSSAHSFFRTLLPLAKHFRSVIAVDLPGNGFSPVPNQGPLNVYQQLEVLLEFRRVVIGEPVFLLGNSLGGGMALNAAFREPESVLALGLVSPAGAQLTDAVFRDLVSSFQVNDVRQARALARKLFAKPSIPLMLFADELRKMVSTETVKRFVAEVSRDEMVRPADVAGLAMPTLLVWGRQEKLMPGEALDFFRTHLPVHAEIHEVDSFGHMPQVEHPVAFVRCVENFARRQRLLQSS